VSVSSPGINLPRPLCEQIPAPHRLLGERGAKSFLDRNDSWAGLAYDLVENMGQAAGGRCAARQEGRLHYRFSVDTEMWAAEGVGLSGVRSGIRFARHQQPRSR
jgi:hypothetical protein